MIRRHRRLRRRRPLGVVAVLGSIGLALVLHSPASSARPPVVAAQPHPRSSPVPVRRAFVAVGGPLVAVVDVAGGDAGGCPVAVLDGAGRVLASGIAGATPLTLRTAAPAGPVAVELRPPRATALSWQVELTGATPAGP